MLQLVKGNRPKSPTARNRRRQTAPTTNVQFDAVEGVRKCILLSLPNLSYQQIFSVGRLVTALAVWNDSGKADSLVEALQTLINRTADDLRAEGVL